MKKIFCAVLFCSAVFAEQSVSEKPVLKKSVSLYETFDNEGVNLGVKADLLYMQYSAPFLSYAASVVNNSAPVYEGGRIYPIKGKAGFGWDFALNYTMAGEPGYTFQSEWYHMLAKFSSSVSAQNIEPTHIAVFTTYAQGTVSNRTHDKIDLIDLCLSKKFSLGKSFTFAPSGGIIGGIMKSRNRTYFNATSGNFGHDATSGVIDQHVKYRGIGVKVGMEYAYNIWGGLNLAGKISYNVLYGYSKLSLFLEDNGILLSYGEDRYSHHHGRGFFDSLIGFSWQRQFSNDSLFLDLHIGWRVQDFHDGWMQYEAEFNDAVHTIALFGQGLEAGFIFKF